MNSIKKIMIIMIILLFAISVIACDQVFQVKRIDTSQAREKNEKNQVNKEEKDNGQDKEVIAGQEIDLEKNKDSSEQNNKSQITPENNEKKNDEHNNKSQITFEGNEKKDDDQKHYNIEEPAQPVVGKGKNSAVLSYLIVTDIYKDEKPGNFKVNYVVGKDHFVYLIAGYYALQKESIVDITWTNNQEDIIYKKETIEIKANENNYFHVFSRLGLTKRVSGQDKLPDALGDYWVIIEIDKNLVSKTKYSIVDE